MSCYDCIHSPICRYFDAATFINIGFAFIDDDKIEQYLTSVTHALAEACSLYKSKGETMKHPKTKCSHCGTESTNQPPGDGCHACQRGAMEVIG